MLEVQKWAKDRPYIIKLFAPQLAATVNDLHNEFKQIKTNRFASQKFPQPQLPTWFALYRKHRTTMKQIKEVFSAAYGKHVIQVIAQPLEEGFQLKNRKKITSTKVKPSPEELEATKKILQTVLSLSEKDLEEEFTNTPVKLTARKRMLKLVAETPLEMSFYLFVAIPCWALYRMSPTRLYRKARQGDFDALEKLLRLDQLMLHDPLIGKRIVEYRFRHSSNKYRKLLDAAKENPKGASSLKNILISFLGQISALSHLINDPLTSRDLFDLVKAVDKDGKTNLAELLPEQDSLTRYMHPDRNLWRSIYNPDKKM